MKETALITGATGMVGSHVLELLLENKTIEKIISIGRRKTGIMNEKLIEIVQDNFLNFSNLISELDNIDICFYCLGVYQNQVPKERFFEITCNYQKALTDILEKTSPNMTFVLFSAGGADTTEKSRTTYAKAKGRAENLLNQTRFPKKYIFRPGYIHPVGARRPPGLMYKLLLPIAGILFKLFPSIGINSNDLAKIMVKVGLDSKSSSKTFENNEMKGMLIQFRR